MQKIVFLRSLISLFNILLISTQAFAYEIKPYAEGINPEAKVQVFNLVFCALNYQNNAEFNQDADSFIQRLRKTQPFDEFKERMGFYYIHLSKKEEGFIFKQAKGFPPLKVRRDFLDGISNYLKSEYKLIIIDAQGNSSCAEFSSAEKMSLIILGKAQYRNTAHFAKGFLHELGHSLGLRDESLSSASGLSAAGWPNCATSFEEAQGWWGDLVGKEQNVDYIWGCCGNKNYIRPTIASLMNDIHKAEDFGPVNERYLREELKIQKDY